MIKKKKCKNSKRKINSKSTCIASYPRKWYARTKEIKKFCKFAIQTRIIWNFMWIFLYTQVRKICKWYTDTKCITKKNFIYFDGIIIVLYSKYNLRFILSTFDMWSGDVCFIIFIIEIPKRVQKWFDPIFCNLHHKHWQIQTKPNKCDFFG